MLTVVHAKGKGDMQTFWLDMVLANEKMPPSTFPENVTDSLAGQVKQILPPIATDCEEKGKVVRLIEWNVDVLLRLIKQIVAWRQSCTLPSNEFVHPVEARFDSSPDSKTLDEVKEIIKLPKFKEVNMEEDPEKVEVDPDVVAQLHDFVSKISCMYRENAFHNFEHASHVAMSVTKLLSRIVAPSEHCKIEENSASTFHDHTYGITSDPLTQFSCVFSAIIHDVDHAGVPNAQLVLEQATVAEYYSGKSVAEQNSVDIAWKLLMEDQYAKLRQTIYVTDEELKRFRQLVVNSVMATDIVDKELKNLRNLRWDRAFSSLSETLNNSDTVDRKATIVIEHLIQASDVAHTMQHWHVYRKWNERFFQECHQAFIDGRAEKNPADSWYEGEIGFFDFYIIPLARKLKDCGVFGVSSDEYYTYAISNREEWKIRGRDVVSEMVAMVKNQGSTMK